MTLNLDLVIIQHTVMYHSPLPTYQISLSSEKPFVDRHMNVQIWTLRPALLC